MLKKRKAKHLQILSCYLCYFCIFVDLRFITTYHTDTVVSSETIRAYTFYSKYSYRVYCGR